MDLPGSASRLVRHALGVLAVLGIGALLSPAAAQSQESSDRSLYWSRLDVRAHLDAEGRLLVLERHEMVFDGPWNGGERDFRLGFGQDLELVRVARERAGAAGGPESGDLVDLVEDEDLHSVDDYAMLSGSKLRWRSRLASDPPFDGRTIPYVIEYVLTGVLQPRGGADYRLDHDFAFPDRDGPIEAFSLRLTLDPAWRSEEGETIVRDVRDLAPGQSYVVTLPLRYEAAGQPAAIWRGSPLPWRVLLVVVVIAGAVLFWMRLWRHERKTGRLEPLPDPSVVDREWLEEHLLSLPPEVAGATWDETTGAPEVAALLARLELEGKITSRVEEKQGFLRTTQELHLELEVPLERFTERERPLIEALFLGSEATSTSRVREHYAKTGFDPSEKLEAVEREAKAVGKGGTRPPKASPWPTVILLILGALLLALGFLEHAHTAVVAAIAAGGSTAVYAIALLGAVFWRNRVSAILVGALAFGIPLAFLVTLPVVLLLFLPLGWASSSGIALWTLALALSVTHQGRGRQSQERIRRRRGLVVARDSLRRELRKEHPDLEDAWIPWLVALGLGSAMDRWSVAHSSNAMSSSALSSTSFSGSGGSAGGFTGGGGSFGGAGASAAWSSAVAGMAAGVAAPGSSGGGGGGGGGSSGGGGGGGW